MLGLNEVGVNELVKDFYKSKVFTLVRVLIELIP